MKVIVIGGGPSGMISAIEASKKHEVVLLDSNNSLGKKLLLTGNGKCNYWNESISAQKYITNDEDILSSILNKKDETLLYLSSLGIYPRIVNGLYYPYSNSSASINTILISKLNDNNVTIINNFKVIDIKKENDTFKIYGENDAYIEGDKVIVATGGKSLPKTGSDGSIFDVLKKLNHNVYELKPSLTRIKLDDNFNSIENTRCNGSIKVIKDGNLIFNETGEILFNSSGISGIVTFNASAYVSNNIESDLYIEIDLMPDIDNLYDWINEQSNNLNNCSLENLFESIFNYKLMFYIFDKMRIKKNNSWNTLTEEEKNRLVNTIKNLRFKVLGVDGFDSCQVTIGGIPLSEINEETMESKIASGLYIVGECLDVTGLCGGFNLSFCFISGLIAGKSI